MLRGYTIVGTRSSQPFLQRGIFSSVHGISSRWFPVSSSRSWNAPGWADMVFILRENLKLSLQRGIDSANRTAVPLLSPVEYLNINLYFWHLFKSKLHVYSVCVQLPGSLRITVRSVLGSCVGECVWTEADTMLSFWLKPTFQFKQLCTFNSSSCVHSFHLRGRTRWKTAVHESLRQWPGKLNLASRRIVCMTLLGS